MRKVLKEAAAWSLLPLVILFLLAVGATRAACYVVGLLMPRRRERPLPAPRSALSRPADEKWDIEFMDEVWKDHLHDPYVRAWTRSHLKNCFALDSAIK